MPRPMKNVNVNFHHVADVHPLYASDPDSMYDIYAQEAERQVAFELHNGFLCTVDE